MKHKYAIHVLRARNREWYWKIVHRNGREIARSSETYKYKRGVQTSLNNMLTAIVNADYSMEVHIGTR